MTKCLPPFLPEDPYVVCKGPHVTLKAHPWCIEKKMFLGAVQQAGLMGQSL